MSYQVVWNPVVEQQLAEIWANARDRSDVSAAADAFDDAVHRTPLNVGESRTGRTRVAFEGPLGFVFDVYQEAQRVVVKSVWRTHR